MTKQTQQAEHISALIDGESDDVQASIDLLLRDPAARQAWAEQHAQRDIMHGGLELKASSGFAASISAALADEPTVLAPKATAAGAKSGAKVVPFLRPVAGLAIAATVAAVTVLSFDGLNSTQPLNQAPAIASVTSSPAPAAVMPVAFTGTYDASDRTYWQGSDDQMQDELNGYLADHAEHANPGGYNSMVPYVRLVGFDGRQQ